jgi:plastocyanin
MDCCRSTRILERVLMYAFIRRPALVIVTMVALVATALGSAAPAQAASKPVIKLQPSSVTAAPGAKVTFVVKAKNVTKYQWQRRSGNKWKSITGAKRSKYSFRARSSANGMKFRVRVTAGKRVQNSRSVTLSVKRVRPQPTPPAPVDPLGSRTNPVPVWTPFNSGAWSFTLEPTDVDAWPEIRSTNMYNDPPLPGYAYVMTTATVTYHGKSSGTPWLNTTAEFLGSNGRVYTVTSDNQWCGVTPRSMSDVDDMYPGASARGTYCAVVPVTAIAGGLWRVHGDNDDYSDSSDVFVRIG